eukprot:1176278-Prorocentrum_minimum.AAC.2
MRGRDERFWFRAHAPHEREEDGCVPELLRGGGGHGHHCPAHASPSDELGPVSHEAIRERAECGRGEGLGQRAVEHQLPQLRRDAKRVLISVNCQTFHG